MACSKTSQILFIIICIKIPGGILQNDMHFIVMSFTEHSRCHVNKSFHAVASEQQQ